MQTIEQELQATRAQLQATIDELEVAGEEMKSSNEEYQSVNEELQSSNEELETSKEEMQSINEELQTINAEMVSNNVMLSRLNSDVKNLLDSTEIATLFLDDQPAPHGRHQLVLGHQSAARLGQHRKQRQCFRSERQAPAGIEQLPARLQHQVPDPEFFAIAHLCSPVRPSG